MSKEQPSTREPQLHEVKSGVVFEYHDLPPRRARESYWLTLDHTLSPAGKTKLNELLPEDELEAWAVKDTILHALFQDTKEQ